MTCSVFQATKQRTKKERRGVKNSSPRSVKTLYLTRWRSLTPALKFGTNVVVAIKRVPIIVVIIIIIVILAADVIVLHGKEHVRGRRQSPGQSRRRSQVNPRARLRDARGSGATPKLNRAGLCLAVFQRRRRRETPNLPKTGEVYGIVTKIKIG